MAPPPAAWRDLANGDLWELCRGDDYFSSTANAINAARTWGSRNGYHVHISERQDGSFRLRMLPKWTILAST